MNEEGNVISSSLSQAEYAKTIGGRAGVQEITLAYGATSKEEVIMICYLANNYLL